MHLLEDLNDMEKNVKKIQLKKIVLSLLPHKNAATLAVFPSFFSIHIYFFIFEVFWMCILGPVFSYIVLFVYLILLKKFSIVLLSLWVLSSPTRKWTLSPRQWKHWVLSLDRQGIPLNVVLFACSHSTTVPLNVISKDCNIFHLWVFHGLFHPITAQACFQCLLSIFLGSQHFLHFRSFPSLQEMTRTSIKGCGSLHGCLGPCWYQLPNNNRVVFSF